MRGPVLIIAGKDLVSLSSVKIIGIDHCKRSVDAALRHQNGMACSPGLLPFNRNKNAFRDHPDLLEYIIHLNMVLEPVDEHFPEPGFEAFLDDKYHFAETGFYGIIN